jgi:hypothetical protein
VSPRHTADDPLPFPGASAQARHVGEGPGFVDEDQMAGVEGGLLRPPLSPSLRYVSSFLFGGVNRFF